MQNNTPSAPGANTKLTHNTDGGMLVIIGIEKFEVEGIITHYQCSVCGRKIDSDEPHRIADPDYPSAIVAATGGGVDEPADGYMGRELPDFVKADNDKFG